MNRKFDTTSKELEQKCIAEVIARIEEIEDGEVGVIAAQEIISIVTQNLGPEIYTMGIHDAKKLVREKWDDVETEIDLLEQSS